MKISVVTMLCALIASGASAVVRPGTMEALPLGSVRAEGWLLKQLEKQRDGLTGHAEELYDDLAHSDWLTNAGKGGEYAWERGPYYARGLVALALTLNDAALVTKARRWVDAILASQRANGDFGPKNDNWWANMLALQIVRDWAAATGDMRVVPFLKRYFAYQLKRLPEHPLLADSMWAACRGGDELDVALWLYDRTGDEEVLALARLVAAQSSDWTGYYRDGGDGAPQEGYRCHIVNFMQGLKLPALLWRLDGRERDRGAYAAAFDPDGWAMRMHGRIDRMVNGTEPLSGRGAAQGTELCAIAERIVSCQKVLAATGETLAADDLETVAFNALPATLGDDGKGLRYYLLLNQPRCILESVIGFECNSRGDAHTPGPDSGFGCCRSNFHIAWPAFVSSLWMRREGGLAAVAYAPSVVTTELATIRTSGGYPFADEVTLEILAAKERKWPLFVRVPGWARGADIAVNGVSVNSAVPGTFARIERVWKKGDRVTLSLPAETVVEHGIYDSVALRRGALVYSLPVASDVTTVERRKGVKEPRQGWPVREYRPTEAWNRVLVLRDRETVDARFEPATRVPDDPFVHGCRPCRLVVPTGRTSYAGWGTLRPDLGWIFTALPLDPPPSPLAERRVTDFATADLVPLGATQTRVTLFPWTTRPFGNPLFDGWYADPQIRRYGDTYWIYPTYSHEFAAQTFFDAFSSKDLRTWTKYPRILTTNAVSWARGCLWAPDACEKDGKYYLFFSANDAYPVGGKRGDGEPQSEPGLAKYGGIGVAVADRPEGPYRDLIGKPLVDRFWNGAQPIDQCVFAYKGDWYMVYGGWHKCNLVRLAPDFKSLVPFEDGKLWRPFTPPEYTEGSVMFERKGIWYFMYSSGGWTDGSYSVKYCMADTPFGPFEFKGKVLGSQLPIATGAGHHSVVCVPGTDDWYICYHRRPIPNFSPHHRVTCLDRLFFNPDGTIRPVVMTTHEEGR